VITLSDGSKTKDARLDLVEQVDERNAEYPVSEALTVGAPVEVRDWQIWTVLNQGAQGACVGFAFTHDVTADPQEWKMAKVFPGSEAKAGATFARSVYFDAQRIDEYRGGEYPGASPRMQGTSLLAGAKVMHRLGYMEAYRWATSVDDLAAAVSQIGPAILGCTWYANMIDTDDEGLIHATGRRVGGHAICVSGVDPDQGVFTLTNSWGTEWGNNGRALVSFKDMAKLLGGRGEACIPIGRATQRA
jgi:hypothetical protein